MKKLILNVNRSGYSIDQVRRTLTVGELIELLSEYDDETPVYFGNDRQSYGWYTYGGITEYDFETVSDEEEEEEE